MYNIKLLNKISNVGLKKYDTSKYVYGDDVQNPDAGYGAFGINARYADARVSSCNSKSRCRNK